MTDQKKLLLQALSQDLYRAALGRYRGQDKMAKRFSDEALRRIVEIGEFDLHEKIVASLNSTDDRSAEDLLMYSTLVKNVSSII